MAKKGKAKLKKKAAAEYRLRAANILHKLEQIGRFGFLVHEDAAVEPTDSGKYVWVDVHMMLRVRPSKRWRAKPTLAPVPRVEEVTA